MALTTAQLAVFKTDILADSTFNNLPHNDDGALVIRDAYNSVFVPNFTVWKTSVPIDQVGQHFNGTELAGLTTANNTRLQTIALYLDYVNPTIADNRQFFDDVFSGAGGANTRAALLALWKRFALRIEKLFATGTGTDLSPATLVYEGTVSIADVKNALGW
jgi:hypothetical protein